MLPTFGTAHLLGSRGPDRYQQKAYWSIQERSASERYSIRLERCVKGLKRWKLELRCKCADLQEIRGSFTYNLKVLFTSPHEHHLCVGEEAI